MGLHLAPTLSYCHADAQRVFLDIGRDRYFCLGAACDAAFQAWAAGQPLSPEDSARLIGLAAQGILVETPGPDRLPTPCPALEAPRISLWDRAGDATTLQTFGAYVRFKRAQILLATRGLAPSLSGVERAGRRSRMSRDAYAQMQIVANAFRGAARYATTRLHCLPHAIAVAQSLAARGAPGRLVIGVRTRPFGAHAWVQVGDQVVNDSVDTVREFTPIRLI